MPDFVEVARVEDLPEDGGLEVKLGKYQIGIFKVEGKIFALENECPHRGGPLHEGQRVGLEIACPWHAWTFHLGTGQCTFVEGICVSTFPVQVKDGKVWVAPLPRGR